MIEMATSAMVMLSALYGGAHATDNSATVAPAIIAEAPSGFVENYTRKYFKDTPILAEIAKCESGFTQFTPDGTIARGKKNKYDVGIMQINEIYHLDDSKKAGMDIYSIDGNLAYAKHIYNLYGTSPWSSSQKCWGKFAKKNVDLAQK